ncbi:MAG: multidrug efflux RND transporter permease subunit [Methylicorpusculum sp.]|uniref:efflux RND transporter permease subunit n=1 Tax=Methylicorpusculum sp. TaxID=2713644 RepID=UPI002718F041|nr:multidrug efflux RND transporter permease subunit [Methylicorpusculum sp.]MDO8938388.1 multidrug efflux RND transporter permease subunit [Methylicorpusculum sp.]MDO9241174.1 multidrug efflux RND transporter permease subunit [Methylicorpusculum sp.]MDP2201531.1 multidrug efflux RND transporter permease subunit [Methylicorpusculum sp.]
MAKFFINRPIVAIVIAILMVMIGLVSMAGLPIAQFPDIAPPEIQVTTTYTGADAVTVEQSVATPIEQQMSGVDNMNYMYSINANNGQMTLRVNFDVETDANTDQVLTQMRKSQAESQLPQDVRNFGVNVQKSTASPLIMFALYSPNGSYDNIFLANYAYININDQMTRVKGIASVTVFGAGQYAMRIWVKPDQLAKLNITIPEIISAVQAQNNVNPAGKVGAEPVPPGQDFTYAVRAQGRLQTEEEFGNIVLRAEPNGSMVRIKDVGRIELGAQTYDLVGRLNGKPAALIALYQLPGSNAIDAAEGAKKTMEELKTRFPDDLEYVVALDTTLAVTEGINEIVHTLLEALVLVILVVFLFLQGWRPTLIPLLAVPVSLIGTFMLFPVLGFSINTLSLFGLVLAIGLVVDDPIVVVESVEHHIENGLSPKEATLKTMEEVTGPIIGTSLALIAVFLPTVFIPGITGKLYQQFAVTVGVSVMISTFNSLSLSPALAALLLKPRVRGTGPVQKFFDGFNRWFGVANKGYVSFCAVLIRKTIISMIFLGILTFITGGLGKSVPMGFLPDEDQGYLYAGIQLPNVSSLQRTDEVSRQVEEILKNTPGVAYYSSVIGYNMLSQATTTYNTFFFISLKNWAERTKPEEQYAAIKAHLNKELSQLPGAIGFSFPPPAIPGVGTSGGVTMIVEDRAGKDVAYLAENTEKFIAEAKKRPEIAGLFTTGLPSVPQIFVDVDRDKVLKQGVQLSDVYKTLQAYMGSGFINYFNRFGRQWQVYVQAEGEYRKDTQSLGQFYVRNSEGNTVPLETLTSIRKTEGPEFTMRYNLFRSQQVSATASPGYSSAQVMKAMEEVFAATMPTDMGYDYIGMSYQEKKAQEGVSPAVVFGFAIFCVFLILAALYESWSLPFSVLLGTPIAIFGAFAGLMVGRYENNLYAQIGLVMLIGLAAKNAILIVEFAKMGVEEGKSVYDASLEAARLRLRPIMMTALSFILGCLPLAVASGAGALSRRVMGYAVIGGMTAATFIAIFLIPVLFYAVETLAGSKKSELPVAREESEHE